MRQVLPALFVVAAAMAAPSVAAGEVSANALLTIDRNRATVIDRIVDQWGGALAHPRSGITAPQLREVLTGLRADHLLAASLAGTLDGLRGTIANALDSAAPVRAKALGDLGSDDSYTPVTPCRLVETRGTFAAVYQGDGTPAHNPFPFAPNANRSYAIQGGNGVCMSQLPAGLNPAAVQLQVFALPVNSAASGDVEILPQGAGFGSTATLVYLGTIAVTSVSTTARINLGNNQIGVQVRGGGAHVAIDVVGYFKAPAGVLVGADNTFVGTQAGNRTMTGAENTGAGAHALGVNTTGYRNAATGFNALSLNTSGGLNTAMGAYTLEANDSGDQNTATGAFAMRLNTTGSNNTANGYQALYNNTTGFFNTAVGANALPNNTTGSRNTAVGNGALGLSNGDYNTAIGNEALANNVGSNNTAAGAYALEKNTSGADNIASGLNALRNNTTGNGNVAVGRDALSANTTGFANTAIGVRALEAANGSENVAIGNLALSVATGTANVAVGSAALLNTQGNENIAIGHFAGLVHGVGDSNIYIGNRGVSNESKTIRIGPLTPGDFGYRTFIDGVFTLPAGGAGVYVHSNGQIGTIASSRRFKENIADMGAESAALMRLRPVTFHYRAADKAQPRRLQYGLIAEEVADVYPELVMHSADGRVETVMYQFLPPMLLNEYQKQQRTIDAQAKELARLGSELSRQGAEIASLRQEREAQMARFEALEARLAELATLRQSMASAVQAGRAD
jgi:hypothetical protein